MGKKTAPDSNEGVGDVFVEKNAGKVTLPAAKQLKGVEGVYDAWLMDDAPTPIEKAVIANDSSAEHYYTLQGAARVVARLNGLLGSWDRQRRTPPCRPRWMRRRRRTPAPPASTCWPMWASRSRLPP